MEIKHGVEALFGQLAPFCVLIGMTASPAFAGAHFSNELSLLKTSQPQCQRIIKGKDEADRSLPAKESRDRLIELAASVLTVSRCAAGIERSIAAIKCFQPLSK